MSVSKKRLLVSASGLTAIAAVAVLVTGITFGLFSATAGPQTNSFASGTVTFGAPTSVPCTVTAMEAGDQSTGYSPPNLGTTAPADAACTFTVTYTGTIPGFIGLVLTPSPTPPAGLYNGTATGLQFQITDSHGTSYTTGGLINANTPTDPLFVGQQSTGTATTYTVNFGLPQASTLQGQSTTLTLTVEAVQASNNGTACTTLGVQCASIPHWS